MIGRTVSVSIVSHGHGVMVSNLIHRLIDFPEVDLIILTKNIPEIIDIPVSPKVYIVENSSPFGFAKNHNAAFSITSSPFFCVLNPDLFFTDNPFPTLLNRLKDLSASLVAPLVLDPSGNIEDSIRYFPTPFSIFKKLIYGERKSYALDFQSACISPEWVAGMFMLFDSNFFSKVNCFDERYYLYYEDVDICARIWRIGGAIHAVPEVKIIHDARRSSRKNLRYLRWHFFSMLRFFIKHLWRLPQVVPGNEK